MDTRRRFFRRAAFAVFAILVLTTIAMTAAVSLVAGRFGLGGWSAGVPAILVVFMAGAGMALALGAMRRFAHPLGEVMDAADRVAEGDYTVRVHEHGPPPIRALAESFNTMSERLQQADRVRRDLMADVAHELRTPLTVLRGRLEGLADGVYPRDDRQIAELLDETAVLARLVEDLRTLALSDAGALHLQTEPTDVAALVRETVESMQAEAAKRSVHLSARTPQEEVVLTVDPVRIREVLTNLLSNALQHTPAGQTVTTTVTTSVTAPGSVTITVADTGEGMAPQDVERMFDRFYKGEGSRGSGLGLAIAKGIVTAHGGAIAATSEPGAGTRVSVSLPA